MLSLDISGAFNNILYKYLLYNIVLDRLKLKSYIEVIDETKVRYSIANTMESKYLKTPLRTNEGKKYNSNTSKNRDIWDFLIEFSPHIYIRCSLHRPDRALNRTLSNK
jgi:hypothetical protein